MTLPPTRLRCFNSEDHNLKLANRNHYHSELLFVKINCAEDWQKSASVVRNLLLRFFNIMYHRHFTVSTDFYTTLPWIHEWQILRSFKAENDCKIQLHFVDMWCQFMIVIVWKENFVNFTHQKKGFKSEVSFSVWERNMDYHSFNTDFECLVSI